MNNENSLVPVESVTDSGVVEATGVDAEVSLEELKKLYSVSPTTTPESGTPDSGEVRNENTEYAYQLDMAIRDIEVAGSAFIEAANRFIRYVGSGAPFRSRVDAELMQTEQFQTLQAACREAPESFAMIVRARKELESSEEESKSVRLKINVHLENLQNIFTITMRDTQELLESVIREHKQLVGEYRNDRQAYEEEEFLRNTISLLSNVNEELKTGSIKVDSYTESLI